MPSLHLFTLFFNVFFKFIFFIFTFLYTNKQARLGGSGGMLPQEFLEIRCSEVASGAVFGQKQSRSSYYQFLAVPRAFAKPADFKFPREKIL